MVETSLSQNSDIYSQFQTFEHNNEVHAKRSGLLPIWSPLHMKSRPLPFWFGPRLGRSKRSTNDIDSEMSCEQIESFVKFLAVLYNSKCVPSTMSKQFSPRLGRNSAEELMDEYQRYYSM